MTENINWKMNEDDEHLQEEPSSRHLLVALEDLLKRSHNNSTFISKIKNQSKSLDDLLIHRRYQQEKDRQISIDNNDNNISNTTKTEFNLSEIGYDDEDNEYNSQIQRSQSAPASPTKIYDKELAAFIQCDQQQQQLIPDNFVYNIDLSYSNETPHQINSRIAIFFEDDFSSEEINYEPSINHISSSLINSCLTITEENEEELEQLRRDDEEQYKQNILLEFNENSIPIIILNDDNDQINIYENDNNQTNDIQSQDMNNLLDKYKDNIERLSTIYESPSPQFDIEDEIYDDTYDKLIVYDIANVDTTTTTSSIIHPIPESPILTSLPYHSSIIDRTRINSYYTDASFEPYSNFPNTLSASHLCGTTTMITSNISNPTNNDENSLSLPVINTHIIPSSFSSKQQSPSRSSPILFPIPTNDQSTQHIKKMKVIQSSSSSLSDFISSSPISILKNTINYEQIPNIHHSLIDCSLINENNSSINNNNKEKSSFTRRILTNGLLLSYCSSNPIPRRIEKSLDTIKQKTEEKFLSDSSSSSELLSSSNIKHLSQSDYIHQQEQNISQQRKATSLKSISKTSTNILYPIDFQNNHINISYQKNQLFHTPISDSGIIIDTCPTSKSSIEEDTKNIDQSKQYEINYRKTLTDLTVIKKNIVNIENRLNEVMRELEIEQSLIEGEHELIFKQILDSSESDQQKIKQLYKNLQLLIERIMSEKNSLENEIDYTQKILFQLEHELYELEQQYHSSDEKILKKKEIISTTRQKYEDLEFQLMELETRCEQAEEYFQNQQKFVTQNAKIRQNTLHELDHQQSMILHEITNEKDKLEREKQKLLLIFKQKKFQANELEQKIISIDEISSSKLIYQDKLNEIKEMIAKVKLEKMSILEQQLRERYNEYKLSDYQVKLREKNRAQERPLTRYLPIRSIDFDLRAHIEGAGHLLDSSHIYLTSTSCRGYLHKMGGMKFKTWNRRWFVFDRQSRSLFYYQDKNEIKLRGCIYFQSILEVYVNHLQSRSREATFIVKTNQRSYYLIAPTVELMRIWIDVIITGAEGNTFAAI